MRKCIYDGKCCMRDDKGECVALIDTTFWDHECHFRKEKTYGPNLYDKKKEILKGAAGTKFRNKL